MNNDLTPLMRSLSHELRTPLTSILALVDKLEHMNLDVEVKKEVACIQEQGQRILKLVNQILSNQPINSNPKSLHSNKEIEAYGSLLPHTSKRILMAEDHPLIRRLHRQFIEELGYTVDVAENGLIALNLYHQKKYAAIITDINLPNLTGIDLASEVRKWECLHQELPIIALTADATLEMKKECLAVGINEVLIKPIEREHLKLILNQYV